MEFGGTLSTFSGSVIAFLVTIVLISLSPLKWQKVQGRLNVNDLFGSLEKYRWNMQLINLQEHFLLMLWLITPIAVPFVISRIFQPIYYIKYTIGASLAWYILAAGGIAKFSGNKVLRSVIIGLMITMATITIYSLYNNPRKVNWREAVGSIEKFAQPNDLVLLETWILMK